jgi:hypothetical protein
MYLPKKRSGAGPWKNVLIGFYCIRFLQDHFLISPEPYKLHGTLLLEIYVQLIYMDS